MAKVVYLSNADGTVTNPVIFCPGCHCVHLFDNPDFDTLEDW